MVDTRVRYLVRHTAVAILSALVLGLATSATSMREIERRSRHVGPAVRRLFDIRGPISDTTLYEFLRLLTWTDLKDVLSRCVLAEWARRNLRPTGITFSVVAFDGKQLIAYTSRQLWALVRQGHGGEVPAGFSGANLKAWFAASHPSIQVVERTAKSGATLYSGLLRSFRMTLVSNPAAPCPALEVIPGDQNEVGYAPTFLRHALPAYRQAAIAQVVTADAGNRSREIALTLRELGSHYFLSLRGNQPAALLEAERLLNSAQSKPSLVGAVEWEHGMRLKRTVWHADARELLERFPDATRVVRVQREVTDPRSNETITSNRYFVTSIPADQLRAADALFIARAHWRCENNGHWTSDVIFNEDEGQRTPLTRNPDMVPIVATLRMLAQNLVAVLRHLSRGHSTKSPVPSWKEVCQHVGRALEGLVRLRSRIEAAATP